MYTALEIIRIPTGQFHTEIDRRTGLAVRREWFSIEWRELGAGSDLVEAKKRYGGSPVLEDAR